MATADAPRLFAVRPTLEALFPLLPFAGMLSAAPYLIAYFKNLWQLAHYQFFPIIIAVVGFLLYTRWTGKKLRPNWIVRLLGPIGIAAIFSGTLFASSWAAYLGFALCFASWLGHQEDSDGGSLIYLAVPMLLLWQPPYSSTITADTILIQELQSVSALLSSRTLDLLGYPHFQPGTILQIAGRSFGVAEACSGIQSFFAVLSVGAILVALQKRGPVHAILLLGTSPFWAVLMNTIRITLIPIAHSNFGIDLSHGFAHEMLGYCTMILSIGLMLSTDELLSGLLRKASLSRGAASAHERRQQSPRYLMGRVPVLIPTVLFLVLCFGIQLSDVFASWGSTLDTVDFFRDLKPIEMDIADAPTSLNGWPRSDYNQISRDHAVADLGERTDNWKYEAPFGAVSVSFDQMFPGWHELTRCYRNGGWTLTNRRILPLSEEFPWPVVEAQFEQRGEHGYLLFSLVNRNGRQLAPPKEWNQWSSLKERLQNRITPAVRGTLFGISAYQLQIFCTTNIPLTETERGEVLARFRNVRNQIWDAARQRIE